jgi:hypothetical protein
MNIEDLDFAVMSKAEINWFTNEKSLLVALFEHRKVSIFEFDPEADVPETSAEWEKFESDLFEGRVETRWAGNYSNSDEALAEFFTIESGKSTYFSIDPAKFISGFQVYELLGAVNPNRAAAFYLPSDSVEYDGIVQKVNAVRGAHVWVNGKPILLLPSRYEALITFTPDLSSKHQFTTVAEYSLVEHSVYGEFGFKYELLRGSNDLCFLRFSRDESDDVRYNRCGGFELEESFESWVSEFDSWMYYFGNGEKPYQFEGIDTDVFKRLRMLVDAHPRGISIRYNPKSTNPVEINEELKIHF